MREEGALCSAILSIAHPDLFEVAQDVAAAASAGGRAVEEALAVWPAIFNRLQVLSNRETPFHRDNSGEATWYDLLLTFGTHDPATLVMRNLGIEVAYGPGSAVLLCSQLIHHGVARVDPDRICYAWFFNRHLQANMHVSDVGWMDVERYDR